VIIIVIDLVITIFRLTLRTIILGICAAIRIVTIYAVFLAVIIQPVKAIYFDPLTVNPRRKQRVIRKTIRSVTGFIYISISVGITLFSAHFFNGASSFLAIEVFVAIIIYSVCALVFKTFAAFAVSGRHTIRRRWRRSLGAGIDNGFPHQSIRCLTLAKFIADTRANKSRVGSAFVNSGYPVNVKIRFFITDIRRSRTPRYYIFINLFTSIILAAQPVWAPARFGFRSISCFKQVENFEFVECG
jgi:hypothetical protein